MRKVRFSANSLPEKTVAQCRQRTRRGSSTDQSSCRSLTPSPQQAQATYLKPVRSGTRATNSSSDIAINGETTNRSFFSDPAGSETL